MSVLETEHVDESKEWHSDEWYQEARKDDWCDVGYCYCFDQPRNECYKCKAWLEIFGVPLQ